MNGFICRTEPEGRGVQQQPSEWQMAHDPTGDFKVGAGFTLYDIKEGCKLDIRAGGGTPRSWEYGTIFRNVKTGQTLRVALPKKCGKMARLIKG